MNLAQFMYFWIAFLLQLFLFSFFVVVNLSKLIDKRTTVILNKRHRVECLISYPNLLSKLAILIEHFHNKIM